MRTSPPRAVCDNDWTKYSMKPIKPTVKTFDTDNDVQNLRLLVCRSGLYAVGLRTCCVCVVGHTRC